MVHALTSTRIDLIVRELDWWKFNTCGAVKKKGREGLLCKATTTMNSLPRVHPLTVATCATRRSRAKNSASCCLLCDVTPFPGLSPCRIRTFLFSESVFLWLPGRYDQHIVSKKHKKLQQAHDRKHGKGKTHKQLAAERRKRQKAAVRAAAGTSTSVTTEDVFAAMDAIGEAEDRATEVPESNVDGNANTNSEPEQKDADDTLLQQADDDDDAWLADAVANMAMGEGTATTKVADDKAADSENDSSANDTDQDAQAKPPTVAKSHAQSGSVIADDDDGSDSDSDSDSDSSSIDLENFAATGSHSYGNAMDAVETVAPEESDEEAAEQQNDGEDTGNGEDHISASSANDTSDAPGVKRAGGWEVSYARTVEY